MLQQVIPPDGTCAESASARAPLQTLLDHRRQFLAFLGRRLSSPALAEAILQNAYLRALEHTGSLDQAQSSTAWFYRVLRNAVVDHYRRRTVEDRALEAWASELVTEVAPDDLTKDLVCKCIAVYSRRSNPPTRRS